MRTWCLLFALGAVVEIRRGLDAASDPCAEDGNFPCVAEGKTTDDIAAKARAIMQERQAAIDTDAEGAVQQGLAVKLPHRDQNGNITHYTYRPFGNTCKKFVQLMVFGQLGGAGLGAGYRTAYCTCGYEILDPTDVVRGDIIQISNDTNPSDTLHVHTAIVLKKRDTVWFEVIDSNYVGSLAIGTHDWDPQPWAKRPPGEYLRIADVAQKNAALARWNNEEKKHWNAHFYRLAPLPVAGTPFPPLPPPEPPPPPSPSLVAVGQFEPDATANPRISEVFRASHAQYADETGFNKLGANIDYPYVVRWGNTGVYVQMFRQPDASKIRYGDGFTWLMYNPEQQWCNLLTATFMATYFTVLGDEVYGVPMNDERLWIGPVGLVLPDRNIYFRQDFSLGKTMLATPSDSGQLAIRIIDWPAGPLRITSDVGAGGAIDPLSLQGWSVSNHQIYLRSSGGIELDQHGYRAWYVNGAYHSTTYTPEITIIGLEPGTTYAFRTEQIQNDELVVTSTPLTLTLPPAEEFRLAAELRLANAVSLSVINHRFAVVWYYLLLRDGVEIARLSGEAFGDFDLEFSRTYTYEAVAMTASHLELGRTNAVVITTQPRPVTPPPPTDPARPASLTLSLDLVEVRVGQPARASTIVFDQYGRAMIGPRVVYVSSHPPTAYPDGDSGIISANLPGTVQFHAELYDDRNLWSPPVTFTVHPVDWTPPVPAVWQAITAEEFVQPDAGRHWSDPDHGAWRRSITYVTLPANYFSTILYLRAQHYEDRLPVDGFTWYPADGRLGVLLQTMAGCELYINGQKVGDWGRPNDYGRNPINLPELGTVNDPSLTLPPVDVTSHLTAGVNSLTLLITAGRRYAELRHLEFVKLGGEVSPPVTLPNLVAELKLQSAAVTADDQAVLGVTVENRSPTACPASTLSLSLDGQLLRTFTVPELSAGGSHRFSVTLDRLPEGSHTVTVVANRDHQIAESEDGNTAELQFTVVPVRQSDLVISGLAAPASGVVGESLPITVTGANQGDAASPPCRLNLGFGGSTAASVAGAIAGPLQFIVPALEPGGEISFATTLTLAVADTFTLWADVDANREVNESDNGNNQASVSFTVVARPPNLVIPTVTMTPVTPTTTDAVTFTATVKNDGQGPSAPCLLTGRVIVAQLGFGGNLPAAEIPALAAGASAAVAVTGGPFPVPAPHVVVFTADGTNLITNETQEDDNQQHIIFTVTETRPDLAIHQVTVTHRGILQVRYDVVVENVGPMVAPFFNGVALQGYLSRDTIFVNSDDRAAGERYLPQSWGLNPGQRMTFSVTASLAAFADYATYQYLVVKVDARDQLAESSDANNTFAARVGLTGTTVFADAMETGLNRWRLNFGAAGNLPVARTTLRPNGGTPGLPNGPVLYLGDRTIGGLATATAEFTVNLAGYTQALLEFDWNTVGLEPREYVALDVFDGLWRREVVRNSTPGWRHAIVDLSRFRRRTNLIIRFRSSMDYPEWSDAAYVDNVKVTAR